MFRPICAAIPSFSSNMTAITRWGWTARASALSTAFIRDALGFAAQLQNLHRSSWVLGEALAEQGLLIDREARATLPDGSHYK
jgi:hypothetical protein